MKIDINMNVDLTPKEARELVGLPDLNPMWDKIVGDDTVLRDRLVTEIKSNVMKVFDPFGIRDMMSKKDT